MIKRVKKRWILLIIIILMSYLVAQCIESDKKIRERRTTCDFSNLHGMDWNIRKPCLEKQFGYKFDGKHKNEFWLGNTKFTFTDYFLFDFRHKTNDPKNYRGAADLIFSVDLNKEKDKPQEFSMKNGFDVVIHYVPNRFLSVQSLASKEKWYDISYNKQLGLTEYLRGMRYPAMGYVEYTTLGLDKKYEKETKQNSGGWGYYSYEHQFKNGRYITFLCTTDATNLSLPSLCWVSKDLKSEYLIAYTIDYQMLTHWQWVDSVASRHIQQALENK